MDFVEQIKALAKTVAELKDHLQTEEATKTALILPFFQALGYNVFNPFEFLPEPAADVGVKQGEKVDYAIMFEKDGQRDPMILVECKWSGASLDRKDSEVFRHFGLSQLFRYFGSTTAKYAILTNGIAYQFFTDLDEPNKMDLTPFLEIDFLNLQENLVVELKRFCKNSFDPISMADTASNLKYSKAIKEYFGKQLEAPEEKFVKWFTAQVYDGSKTTAVIERFTGIVQSALNDFIAERLSDKIRNAFGDAAVPRKGEAVSPPAVEDSEKSEEKAAMTDEELEAFYAVKSMLHGVISLDRITCKKSDSYFSIYVDGMVSRWICRQKAGKKFKTLVFPKLVEEPYDKETKRDFVSVDELYQYAEVIRLSAGRFTNEA